MFTRSSIVPSFLSAMYLTGIILAPAAIATPAVQDLVDLRTIITAAANSIGAENNPNKGWGFNLLGSGGQLVTADLVNNITTTILRAKWQLDTNKTSWLLPSNATNTTFTTPTLPLTSSIVLPSSLPTTTPTLDNITTDLSTPYIDYVSSIPNLSSSLTLLGRAYHREMNAPVHEAIAGLQQSLSTLQTTMLQSDLISSQAVIRTIRASSSLEDAQQAWSRFLNLPGKVGGSGDRTAGSGDGTVSGDTRRFSLKKRAAIWLQPQRLYTHKELWGRDKQKGRSPVEEEILRWVEQHARQRVDGILAHPFVA